jgi:hypothetical protein
VKVVASVAETGDVGNEGSIETVGFGPVGAEVPMGVVEYIN